MAWDTATTPLPLLLLVLLASGSWGQQSELLHKLEGKTVFVTCRYPQQQSLKTKSWCRQSSGRFCNILVTCSRPYIVCRNSRYFIQDYPRLSYFSITMTGLSAEDSGVYWCGTQESLDISILKIIRLVVSPASTLPTTRSARRTMAWTSATSPAIDSPPGHWSIIASVMVAVLLLLVLVLLVALYLRKARGRAGTGKDKSHHINDISAHEDQTTVHRKDPSPGQRESPLSWGFDQQMGSGKDPGDIHYASITHWNHAIPEDSIYVNTHPTPKPISDPFLLVEYASIAQNRAQSSKPAALEEESRI